MPPSTRRHVLPRELGRKSRYSVPVAEPSADVDGLQAANLTERIDEATRPSGKAAAARASSRRRASGEQFRRELAGRSLSLDALALDEHGTIVRPPRQLSRVAIEELPLVVDQDCAEPGEVVALRYGEVTGSGGMGVVRSATQLPLGRRVAVKTPRADGGDSVTALIAEALISGMLDHPNIAPVHLLGRDRRGQPMLVMKFIEGAPWTRELMQSNRMTRLSRHLGILIQVCNAVEFAHSRGIVHRDIKPSNVMIGPFGEVYLVDWGLAVSISDDPGPLPRARDIKSIEGTPSFMPPELTVADGSRVDARTDVYLLGGLLHVILTGAPPHISDAIDQRLEEAYYSAPRSFDATVPRELATICSRALQANREDRYPSAAELRDALAAYLEHASSVALSTTASVRLEVLSSLVTEVDADPAKVSALITEARFGFRAALQSWPDNEEAKRGVQRVLELGAGYELRRKNRDAAAALMAALPRRNDELEAQLEELERAMRDDDKRLHELEQIARANDLRVDERKRMWAMTLVGATVTLGVGGLMVARALHGRETSYADALLLICMAFAISLVTLWRQARVSNDANIRVGRAFLIIVAMGALQLCLSWWAGIDFTRGMALLMATFAACAFVTAAVATREALAGGVACALTAVAIVAYPSRRPLWLGIGFLSTFVSISLATKSRSWREERRRGQAQ
jgi:serine/threonine-protein kinase